MTRRPVALLALALALVTASCGDGEVASPSTAAVQAEAAGDEAAGPTYDLQGHRGARGLRPENTLPSFELALDLMVDTLELDLHLSADDVAVVWHDPVIDDEKCDVAEPVAVRDLTAAELLAITCERNPDVDRFPDQTATPGMVTGDEYGIPALGDVFRMVETYGSSDLKTDAQRSQASVVRFNVETKRKPDDPDAIGDDFDGSSVGVLEQAIVAAADAAGVLDRVTVQSFDHRSLWAIAAEYPDVTLAALTRRNELPDFSDLEARGATIWSPDYRSVSETTLAQAGEAGLLVIPWTINDPDVMAELLAAGVDGIITDRPDLAPDR